MSVSRAQSEIDSREFAEWMAYSEVEPFGPEREDSRFGLLAALTANVHRDPKTRQEPYEPEDFLPTYETRVRPPEETQAADLGSKLRSWATKMNAAASQAGKRPKSELRAKRKR